MNNTKFRFFLISLIFLLIVFASFNKIIFLFNLIGFSLTPNPETEDNMELIVKSYFKNERLYPLIEKRFIRNDFLLAFSAIEIIKEYREDRLKSNYEIIIPNIIRAFEANNFNDYLNFYKNSRSAKDFSNLDFLFFKVLEDKELNSLSFTVITESIFNNRISSQDLYNLILFLNWRQNFSLSKRLLNWGAKEKKLNKSQFVFLSKDYFFRANAQQNKPNKLRPKKINLEPKLKKIFINKDAKINLGRNLINGGNFQKNFLLKKYWSFSDISDSKNISKGAFYGDNDFIEKTSIRIMGFFVERTKGKSRARGGFQYINKINIEEKQYVFYCKYKMLNKTGSPKIWLSDQTKINLPPTNSKWKEVFYFLDNQIIKEKDIKPLLQIWDAGSVWFDDIYFSEIEIQGASIEQNLFLIQ